MGIKFASSRLVRVARAARLSGGIMTIRALIVEDEQDLVALLRLHLEREGFEVHEALDGPAALEIARRVDLDVVVLDWMLPKLGGMEVLRELRSFSDADVNPLSLFDPTLYELEWEAHKTSGEYMLCVARDEYLEEGLQLLILGHEAERGCFLNEEGIGCRLRDNYGLTLDLNPGPRASELLGLRSRI